MWKTVLDFLVEHGADIVAMLGLSGWLARRSKRKAQIERIASQVSNAVIALVRSGMLPDGRSAELERFRQMAEDVLDELGLTLSADEWDTAEAIYTDKAHAFAAHHIPDELASAASRGAEIVAIIEAANRKGWTNGVAPKR